MTIAAHRSLFHIVWPCPKVLRLGCYPLPYLLARVAQSESEHYYAQHRYPRKNIGRKRRVLCSLLSSVIRSLELLDSLYCVSQLVERKESFSTWSSTRARFKNKAWRCTSHVWPRKPSWEPSTRFRILRRRPIGEFRSPLWLFSCGVVLFCRSLFLYVVTTRAQQAKSGHPWCVYETIPSL